jgi:magnesium transporter
MLCPAKIVSSPSASANVDSVSANGPESATWDGPPTPFLRNASRDEIECHVRAGRFFWLDVEGPSDADFRSLGEQLGLHPLTIDDAENFDQRPTIEEYPGYLYMVVYGIDEIVPEEPDLCEVHMIISSGWVVTIRRRPLVALESLRERFKDRTLRSQLFLVYKILDAVVATFFPVLARIDDEIEDIENEVIGSQTSETLVRISALKRDLIEMRRVVTPLRDVFGHSAGWAIALPGIGSDDRLYFRDLWQSVSRVSELVDSYRDLLTGATDMYLSTVANRHADDQKQLTIIATIFLPLTFITGFFGMNFGYMTNELIETPLSFALFGVGLLIAATVAFIIYFRKRGWIGHRQAEGRPATRTPVGERRDGGRTPRRGEPIDAAPNRR